MRRFIIQKKANSLVFDDKQGLRLDSEDCKNLPRPQTSCQKTEISQENPYFETDNSNKSFKSYRKTQLLYLETLGNLKEDFVNSSKHNYRYSRATKKTVPGCFNNAETSTVHKHKKKNLNFCIKGRPLTSHSLQPDRRKTTQIITLKKRSSIFSYGDSEILTPLDPKFYDDEYRIQEDFTNYIQSPPSKASIGILAKSPQIPEKIVTDSEIHNFSFTPQYFSIPKTRTNQKVSLIVSTPYAPTTKTLTFKRKGKLLKGLSSRPTVAKRSKLIHNIQVS